MMRNLTALGLVVIVVAGVSAEDSKSPIDGNWVVESVSRESKADTNYEGASRTHADGKYVMKPAKGKEFAAAEGTFTVDTEKKTIDMKPTSGRYKDKTLLGIYSLNKDVLFIAFAEPGKDRPTTTESKVGSGVVVAVMKKAK